MLCIERGGRSSAGKATPFSILQDFFFKFIYFIGGGALPGGIEGKGKEILSRLPPHIKLDPELDLTTMRPWSELKPTERSRRSLLQKIFFTSMISTDISSLLDFKCLICISVFPFRLCLIHLYISTIHLNASWINDLVSSVGTVVADP